MNFAADGTLQCDCQRTDVFHVCSTFMLILSFLLREKSVFWSMEQFGFVGMGCSELLSDWKELKYYILIVQR